MDRILVFPLIQTAHRDVAVLIAESFTSEDERVGNGIKELSFGAVFRLLRLLGGHLPRINLVEDFLPALGALYGVEFERNIVEA